MKSIKGLVFSSMVSTWLATTLIPLHALAQNANTGNAKQSITPQAATRASFQYWSNERMRKAKSAELLFPGTQQQPRSAVIPSLSPPGPPTSAPSGLPKRSRSLAQRTTSVNQATSPHPLNYHYPFPYTRYQVSSDNYQDFPNRMVGKLFYTHAITGDDWVCSASAVNSTNKRLIVTAGHCVSDGKGHWHTNFMFVPAYNPNHLDPDRREPYGRWSGCGVYTKLAWLNNSNFGQDLGMIKACDQGSEKLHDTVGFLGYWANASRNQTWHAFGYPGEAPFDGTKMTVCKAPHGTDDSSVSPPRIGIGCDMTGGSSGGPWILNYSSQGGNSNYVNGVNSWKYYAQPEAMYSPYFGDEFLSLRNYAIDDGA